MPVHEGCIHTVKLQSLPASPHTDSWKPLKTVNGGVTRID